MINYHKLKNTDRLLDPFYMGCHRHPVLFWVQMRCFKFFENNTGCQWQPITFWFQKAAPIQLSGLPQDSKYEHFKLGPQLSKFKAQNWPLLLDYKTKSVFKSNTFDTLTQEIRWLSGEAIYETLTIFWFSEEGSIFSLNKIISSVIL